ncbi:LysR substrate-binding domain-containing protein [Bradyrhizobium sp. CSS354]|uniref:LysR substrate-binding domain-containing protein n=1 Tax=Bradyrhizobium sp. CSS354 TaxID=2699172 RepID=UPI0023B09873|nr:LysR substrate-binding domain-containing protein [Bradyrhizobium sp. CSS354]
MPEARWLSKHFPRCRLSFRTDSQSAQAVAARAGAGIALLPHFVGKSKDGLFTCNLEREPLIRELWLIMRRQSRESLPIKTVADHISFTFDDESKLFQ